MSKSHSSFSHAASGAWQAVCGVAFQETSFEGISAGPTKKQAADDT